MICESNFTEYNTNGNLWEPPLGMLGAMYRGNGNMLDGSGNPILFSGHLGTGNFLFTDGHVKSLRPTQTMTPVNMWGRFDPQSAGTGPGCDGAGDLYTNPNCTVPHAGILAALQQVEAKYR